MNHLDDLILRYPALEACAPQITLACEALTTCFRKGGKLVLCGNGGSCADADHMAGELMKSFVKQRPLNADAVLALEKIDPQRGPALAKALQTPLCAISLNGLPALSSAFANDVDPVYQYAQQAFAYAAPGDVFLGISTSGNAENVLAAAVAAKARGAYAIGLTGEHGGQMNGLFDLLIKVPASETYKIQELHLPVYHAICLQVEDVLF